MTPLYPPGPVAAPPELTRLSGQYRMQVVLVLGSLLVTALLYVGLVIGSAMLCRWLVIAPWPDRMDRGYGFVRIAAIICSGLLFLYLLKGLFKRSKFKNDWLVEIKPAEQ